MEPVETLSALHAELSAGRVALCQHRPDCSPLSGYFFPMKPHYPITHREDRSVPATVILVTLGALLGMALTLSAIAWTHCHL